MAEQAYSLELNKTIDAKKAVEMSCKGLLRDCRAFKCSDSCCSIDLTCTNWGNREGKRFFFTPTKNNDLHKIWCNNISQDELSELIIAETRRAKRIIKKNSKIIMLAAPSKSKSESNETNNNSLQRKPSSSFNRQGNSGSDKRESRHIYSLQTFVNLFKEKMTNSSEKNISIENEVVSLDELFVNIDDHIILSKLRIHYGLAKLKYINSDGLLEIRFINNKLKIYSNINQIVRRKNQMFIESIVGTDKLVVVYARGYLIKKDNYYRLNRFSDKFYQDLYFEIPR